MGPDDPVRGQRHLDVVTRPEVDDIVVAIEIDPFGRVRLDDIVGIDFGMFVSHIPEELESVVLRLVRQFADQPEGLPL